MRVAHTLSMPRLNEQIDEHILAAYLTGNLPTSLRREIASYIAQSERARDLLSMANDALEEVDSGDGMARDRSRAKQYSPFVPPRSLVTEPEQERRFWKVAALFASSILVLAITVGLFAYDYRSQTNKSADATWAPSVASEHLEVSWLGQQDAESYHIMVQNQESGISSLLTRTQQTSYDISSEVFSFASRTPYQVWILAVDADEQILGRSQSITILERK